MSKLDSLFAVNMFTKNTVEGAIRVLIEQGYDQRMIKSVEIAEEVHGLTSTEGVNVVLYIADQFIHRLVRKITGDGYTINKIENAELGS